MKSHKSIIGTYGEWADSLRSPMGKLSFRNEMHRDLSFWKRKATEAVKRIIAAPTIDEVPNVRVEKRYVYDGLSIEELSWQLPYGNRTKAIVLKPVGSQGKLPAVLALHDHGSQKFFGYEKITQTSLEQHPLIKQHQAKDYEGHAWANNLAKRGYVVMVHDTFGFGSRRVHYKDVRGIDYGYCTTDGLRESTEIEDVIRYNAWAADHEHIMAKSLFSAGTTWPGVVLEEDRIALSLLASRPDVDAANIGCGGLSGGGLRTTYLAGLDSRIKCAVCVGFMTTWTDFIKHTSYKHTWMTYTPQLANELEFAEILGLRVPLASLVLNNNQDELFTLAEMQKATTILSEVYAKANSEESYKASYYDGRHKFDTLMQQEAFDWFDQWLR